MGFCSFHHLALALCVFLLQCTAQSTDGGRGDLPGMKKDIFDHMKDVKNKGGAGAKEAKRPECPKSDGLSPLQAFAIVQKQIFVKLSDSDPTCRRLISIGGANTSSLFAAAKTCGAAGEWKKRVAEELSAMYFIHGGDAWPKSDGEPIELELEDGNFSIPITAENYEKIKECWARGCGCEQASNPKMKMVLFACLLLALTGLGWDVISALSTKIFGDKKKDKDKKEKKEKKDKKEKKEKKAKKGDDEATTGDEATTDKSDKESATDKEKEDEDEKEDEKEAEKKTEDSK